MKIVKLLGAGALALAVAACGGGGGSTPPPSGGGGGTPSPSPSPSPVTYTKFADLTGDQQFRAACAGLYNLQLPIESGGYKRYPDPPTALSHDYAAASQTWTIRGRSPDGVEFTNTFGPANIVTANSPNTTSYRVVDGTGFGNRFFFVTPTIGTTLAEYSRNTLLFVRPGSGTMSMSCVLGVPTLLTDRPATTVNYREFTITGNVFIQNPAGAPRQFEISESTATLSANPVTGIIDFDINLIGREFIGPGVLSDTRTQFGAFGGESGINGTEQNFGAPFTRKPDNSVGGGMAGWFFGPQGQEAGISFTYFGLDASQTNISFSGTLSARK